MRWLWPLLLGILAACAPVPKPTSDPLTYDAESWNKANHVIIGIPGALSPIQVLAPISDFSAPRRAVAFYRLPGFDGRPGDEFINIEFAAAHISSAVQDGRFTHVDLIGHSTGAAIALEAAKSIRRVTPNVSVRVANISTALPAPQPVWAGVRAAAGTVGAALRTGSLDPRTVWFDYYRTLAYGRTNVRADNAAGAADALVAANQDRIALPQDGLGQRHTRALRQWTNEKPEDLAGTQITFYHGAVDPVFPARAVTRFAQSLPNADTLLVQGHGHLLMLTYPSIWSQIAKDLSY